MKKLFATVLFAAVISSSSAYALGPAQAHVAKSNILKSINHANPSFKGSIETVKLGVAKGDLIKFTATSNELWGGAWKTTGTFNTKTNAIAHSTTTETN